MKFLTLTIISFYSVFIFSQTGNLKGKISDESGPVPSVNVFLVDVGIGTGADANGFYEIKNIPAGEYQIRFSAVGHQTQTINVKIFPNKTIELNVTLNVAAIEIQSVEVTGMKVQQQSDTRTSLIDLNPRNAKILPGAAEDVLRTLQSLPGVLAPNDFSSQLVIRGSGPDQNLIIMDDVEILIHTDFTVL
jgi:hypothetical protein